MPWIFNPSKVDIDWVTPPEQIVDQAILDIGSVGSDVGLDTGNRNNTSTIIDQGNRVVDGSTKPSGQGI